MRKTLITSLALAIVGTALAAGSAMALPTLSLSNGATTVTISDNVLGDANDASGAVTFVGKIGVWSTNVSTGLTMPEIGDAIRPQLDLNSVDVSSSSGGTLTINFWETGFGPWPIDLTGFSFDVGGTTQGTVDVDAWISLSNSSDITDSSWTKLVDLGPFSGGAFSGADWTNMIGNGNYSLWIEATITHDPSGLNKKTTSFDAHLKPVPEPATMLLFGTGLAGLAGIARKRVKKA